MGSFNSKSNAVVPPAAPSTSGSENNRGRSIATRLTEAEFSEVESAASEAGMRVAEWLREAALTQARKADEEGEHTDPILLAEVLGCAD